VHVTNDCCGLLAHILRTAGTYTAGTYTDCHTAGVPPQHADNNSLNIPYSRCVSLMYLSSQVGEPARGEEFRVISGPVLVTKHPVTHPGDVRILTAVDTPAARSYLGHHKNELVFSVRGDRWDALCLGPTIWYHCMWTFLS
jgi:RNA-dependent RNA polymerase